MCLLERVRELRRIKRDIHGLRVGGRALKVAIAGFVLLLERARAPARLLELEVDLWQLEVGCCVQVGNFLAEFGSELEIVLRSKQRLTIL